MNENDTPRPYESPPPPPAHPAPPGYYPPPPPEKRSAGKKVMRVIGWILFLGSIIMNIVLVIALVGVTVAAMSGSLGQMPMNKQVLKDGNEQQGVAIYGVNGIIEDTAAQRFEKFFQQVGKDDNVKAVILKVNSPGGTVPASLSIHHRITQLRRQGKIVVVTMEGLAASGGYMISAPADAIIAQPSTLTGSIGVIMQYVNLQGTLDKIGMEMFTFTSRDARMWKDVPSPFRSPTPRERDRFVEILNRMQSDFNRIVRQGRGEKLKTRKQSYEVTLGEGQNEKTVTIEETAPLNGKVYLAEEALGFGLIDQIGYIDEAIDRAAELAGLDSPRVVRYSHRMPLFGSLLGALAEKPFPLSRATIDEFRTPRIMLLWTVE